MSLLPNLDQMTDNEKLAVLESIQKSIAQSKEIQKRKIGENVDLVVQALKKIESDIRDRFDSVGNSIEKRVSTIKDGRDGSNGKDGRDGKDGKSGKDGLKGEKGDRGQDGRDGLDGVDGISVVNANIDFDGSLIISLSDGREINVGEVVSADVAEKIKVISTMSTNAAIAIKDEGSTITSSVKNINFVGAAVTATNSGDDVTVNVSAGTGTVTSVAATGGTGISVSGSPITTTGTLTITNTAPDQTVALTASTGISTSGTYPNFTIANTAPDQTVVLTAGTGISTSGTYPNFTVTNSAPDQTVSLTGAGTTSISGTYPNFTITSADSTVGTVTSVGGTGTVSGISLSGTVTSSGNLTLGGSLDLSSPPTIGNTTPNTGTFTTLTVNDNSTLGSSNADTVTFTARIDSEFSPATDNTYDLGRTGHEWRDLYIDGTANIDSLIADTADINAGTIDGTTIGASSASTGAFTTLSATGVTTVQAGTALLPAITTSGDTNTGIFFPAADTIAFAEGGAEAMRIDSSGNVTMTGTLATSSRGIAKASMPAGTILQVVQSTTVSAATSNSNSYASTGFSVSITPSATSSKILLFCNFGWSSDTANFGFFAFGVNGTADTNTIITCLNQSASGANNSLYFSSLSYIFSPASVSAQTYTLQFRCSDAPTQSLFFNDRGIGGASGLCTLTAMEIAV
jgi:hypothetical protein